MGAESTSLTTGLFLKAAVLLDLFPKGFPSCWWICFGDVAGGFWFGFVCLLWAWWKSSSHGLGLSVVETGPWPETPAMWSEAATVLFESVRNDLRRMPEDCKLNKGNLVSLQFSKERTCFWQSPNPADPCC